jgi:hypothetical protein
LVAGPPGFEVRIAWRRDDPAIEADAIDFWTRNGLLPEGVSPEQRAKELVAAAYKNGVLVAVATAVPEQIGFLRARCLRLRSMADPGCPRDDVEAAFAAPIRRALEGWAADHPEETLAGVVTFVEPRAWGELARMPVWPDSRLTLVGYLNDGRQVRAFWFDHFRFD